MADTSLDKLMKLSAALPSEDAENGLDHLAQQAYENPKGTIIIGIVVLDTLETKYRPATDQEVAVVRIREIEAVRLTPPRTCTSSSATCGPAGAAPRRTSCPVRMSRSRTTSPTRRTRGRRSTPTQSPLCRRMRTA